MVEPHDATASSVQGNAVRRRPCADPTAIPALPTFANPIVGARRPSPRDLLNRVRDVVRNPLAHLKAQAHVPPSARLASTFRRTHHVRRLSTVAATSAAIVVAFAVTSMAAGQDGFFVADPPRPPEPTETSAPVISSPPPTTKAAAPTPTTPPIDDGIDPDAEDSAVDPQLADANTEGQPAWLARLNALRALNGAAPVVEDKALSRANVLHAKYMALNGAIGHDESPGAPGYTAAGRKSAQSSNVAMGGSGWSAARYVDVWATAPFHAIGLLRPGLKRVGFGSYVKGGQSYAALDVMQGLSSSSQNNAKYPRYWPTGPKVNLYAYSGAEWPDPTAACGGGSNYGLPMIADFGENAVLTSASTVLKAGGKTIPTCTTLAKDHGGNAWALGKSRVLIMPRSRLKKGTTYTGTVKTNKGSVKINFTTS